MDTLVGIIVLGCIWVGCSVVPKRKFHNYIAPKGEKVDYNEFSLDKIKNNLSDRQVMENTINGKYNKKEERK